MGNVLAAIVTAVLNALFSRFVKQPTQEKVEIGVDVKVKEAIEVERRVDTELSANPDKLREHDKFERS